MGYNLQSCQIKISDTPQLKAKIRHLMFESLVVSISVCRFPLSLSIVHVTCTYNYTYIHTFKQTANPQ